MSWNWLSVVVLSVLVLWVDAGYHSCHDVYLEKPGRPSGVYRLYNMEGEIFNAFCDFYDDYGYMYITRSTLNHIDLHPLYTDRSHVMVRILKEDGTQKEVRIDQHSSHTNSYFLTILYDKADGFTTPKNPNMAPYLYLGFLPASVASSQNTKGYGAGGQDFTSAANCGSDPNNYLAFFFNPSNSATVNYCPQCSNAFINGWMQQAQNMVSSRHMPDEFYFPFEMDMGGQCGGYISSDRITDVRGAALGLRFNACPPGFQRHKTSCFSLLPVPATWGMALQLCETFHGVLVTIHDDDEQAFLSKMIAESTDPAAASVTKVWLDGTNMLEKGTWHWTKPVEPILYHNYATGAPSSTGRCLAMQTSDWKWTDMDCNSNGIYPLCEIHL